MTITDEIETDQTPEQIHARQQRVDAYLADLAHMLKFLNAHQDLIPDTGGGLTFTVSTWSAKELATRLRQLGACEKIDSDYFAGGKVKFGDHTVQVHTSKDNTCEKVPTGEVKTKAVEANPSEVVPEGARNVRTITKTVYDIDEEITEWSCADSLLNPAPADG